MRKARMIGNYAQNRAQDLGLSVKEIGNAIDLTDSETISFFKGRIMLTYDQLMTLAEKLQTSVEQILNGDEKEYEESVVHNMNDFDDYNNRELILDIIDDYMDVRDSVITE